MKGIQNVIATSGTAFTEQQVGLLRRQTTNVVVNFDPDAAGANAAEKSIALLTEEGFTIRIITLEGGLDPDRFIRQHGDKAYAAAIRSARRQSDYLIERARQNFPGASADAKIKAMNYLLPHIRRIPHKLERDQFAHDAAQKLGIDSAVLREELRQAALKRQDRVESRPSTLTEVERVLLRALAITESGFESSSNAVIEAITAQPAYFEHLGSFICLQALASRNGTDPMETIKDPAQRALLAEVLLHEVEPPSETAVHSAIQQIQERALESQRREIIVLIVEAEAHGDFAEVVILTQKKMALDRALRELHNR
jgi:DNA primase